MNEPAPFEKPFLGLAEDGVEADATLPRYPDQVRPVVACPACEHTLQPGELVCTLCGALTTPTAQTGRLENKDLVLPVSRVGAAYVGQTQPIRLTFQHQIIHLPALEHVILGRIGGVPPAPYVDLSHFNAARLGVSRRHLSLSRNHDLVYIADLNSLNGTWLNGQKLMPHDARLLRSGDELLLGSLRLDVYFG
jgi:FHA domain